MSRNRDEYGAIWGRGPLPGAGEELDGLGLAPTDDLYSDVYDEDGDEVLCDICGSEVKWREQDGTYIHTAEFEADGTIYSVSFIADADMRTAWENASDMILHSIVL